jgi:hypothetical protein
MMRVRALVSLGLVVSVVGCGPAVVNQPGGTTGGSGGNSAGSANGGANNGGSGSDTNGTAGSNGGNTSGTGGTNGTAGNGGSTAGRGGTTSGGANGGSAGNPGGSTGGPGGSTGGPGGSTGGPGGSTAGNAGGSTGGTGGTRPVQIAGSYDVTTQFNLLDALPPEVKTALSLALELADSPGKFLLDMADRIPVIKYVIDALNLFSGIRDQITKGIDEYINRWSGGLVTTLHGISGDIEMALRGLKAHNHIVITGPDSSGNITVDDTLVDLTFTYNGQDHAYPEQAKSHATGTATGLRLTIAAHNYDHGVQLGGILVDLIDNVALPQLTGVTSLGELLNQLVNCGGVGDWVWSYIGNFCIGDQCIYKYISANDVAKLCTNALDFAGTLIEGQISRLDAPGMMAVTDGQCLAVENQGHTGHADSISNGQWSLSLPVGVGTLTLPGSFSGAVSH